MPEPMRGDPRYLPGGPLNRRAVRSFGVWDWGMSAFSSVILTFVFSTYLTSGVATAGIEGEAAIERAAAHGSTVLSTAQFWGALALALLAPLLGSLADTGGHRNLFLRIATLGTVGTVALMPLVRPEQSDLALGAILIALALLFSELAGVFVNSVLPQLSSLENRGRVSGTAWALGYFGSILCLLIVLFGFVMPGTGLLGIPGEGALNLRLVPLFVAVWILVFTLPLMRQAPPLPRRPDAQRWTPWGGYRDIVTRVVRMWHENRRLLHFFVASAIYRDGLGAVFAFAGVIAAASYGFATTEVIIFGIAANLTAGIGVWLGGKLDDWLGPRTVIVGGCAALLVFGSVVLLIDSNAVFWVCGLLLAMFVGPIQSASRSLLTKLSDQDHETEDFGLYATTGRAFGFLSAGAFGVTVALFESTRMGILGILAVILLGLLVFLPLDLGVVGTGRRQRDRELAAR